MDSDIFNALCETSTDLLKATSELMLLEVATVIQTEIRPSVFPEIYINKIVKTFTHL